MSEAISIEIGDRVTVNNQDFTVVGLQVMQDRAGLALNIRAQDETLAAGTLAECERQRQQARVIGGGQRPALRAVDGGQAEGETQG